MTLVTLVPRLRRVRELRLRAALTQIDLADLSGVGRTTIIRVEAGEPNPLPSTVRKLAAALRVKPEDLLGADDQLVQTY